MSDRNPDEIDVKNHVIIAGSGFVGGLINRMLKAAGFEATLIDYSSKHPENLRTFGIHNYFGDAVRPDLLHPAGIKDAKLFNISIDNKDQITELTRYIHQN